MQFKNKTLWEEGLRKNVDGQIGAYNGRIYFFAELWALLMEAALFEAGEPKKTVGAVADDASRRADDVMFRSVTNFQYLQAVSILGECWKHGEDLVLWHRINAALYKNEIADEQAMRLFTGTGLGQLIYGSNEENQTPEPEIEKEESVIKRGYEFI